MENKNLPEINENTPVNEEIVEIAQAPVETTAETPVQPPVEAETPAEKAPAYTPAAPAPQKPEPKKAKSSFNFGKLKRGSMATLISVVFIAIIVVLNILVTALTERFPSMDIDITANKVNSLSDQALSVAESVTEETYLYLIGEENAYRQDQLYASYNIKYSQVSNLCDRLHEANPLIKVEYVDPDTNPDFIAEYASESLTSGMVLVKTDKRYQILAASDMFNITTDYTTYQQQTYSRVDSALASAIEAVNLDKMPVLTIATGNAEMLGSTYLTAFTEMMTNENFEVREIDILTEDIPAETQILMIPTPTGDYTDEQIAKLRTFLDDESRTDPATLLVTCHPTQGKLPKLNAFLEEWGISVGEGIVAETDASRVAVNDASYVIVDEASELLSENYYERIISASSSPLTLTFDENGGVTTTAVWTTAASAYVLTETTTQEEAASPETGEQTVFALAQKTVANTQRNVIVSGSSLVFMEQFLQTTAFGNGAYITDLLNYAAGTDGSAVTVVEENVQTYVLDVTASQSTVIFLGLGVFTIGLPILILALGLVVFLKRRHL